MKFRYTIVFLLVIILLIFLLAMINVQPYLIFTVPHADRYYHIAAFVVLVVYARWYFRKFPVLLLVSKAIGYGIVIEMAQYFFTHGIRQFDLKDIFFNMFGIGLGIFISFIIILRTKQSHLSIVKG